MLPKTIITLLGLAGTVITKPLQCFPRAANPLSTQDLINIAPDTCTCDGADFPDECRTAAVAAPNIARSFQQFNLTSFFGIQAAALAIQLFESGNFKYNRNHFPAPGVPGQGTRNMQSPAFNELYAEYIAANVADGGITLEQVEAAKAAGPVAVLELVNVDRWSFASAAWFIGTQCSESVKDGLVAGTLEGFASYITECVGTTLTDERTAGWQKVISLGGW